MLFSSAKGGMVQVNLYLGLLKSNRKDKGKIQSWILMVRCSVRELSIHDLIIGVKRHTGECQHTTGGLLASFSVYPWPVLWLLKQETQVQKLLWVHALLSNVSVIPHPRIHQSGFPNHWDCSSLYCMLIKFGSRKENRSHAVLNLYDCVLSYLSLEYETIGIMFRSLHANAMNEDSWSLLRVM